MDCKPDYLRQFAVMGSAYMRGVLRVSNPKVGLLNVGAEEEKGNELVKAASPLLREQPGIDFSGNVEARDAFPARCRCSWPTALPATCCSNPRKERWVSCSRSLSPP